MSKWRYELALNFRYVIAGIFNSIVGLTAIWGATKLGATPIVANVVGYAIGLSVGFLTAKTFAFRSAGNTAWEAVSYVGAFLFSYLVNVAVLYIGITWSSIDIMIAQGLAVGSYVVSMYCLSRLYVFSR